MRRHAKAPSAGSTMGTGTTRARKSLFGMVCVCVVGLAAFLGSGAPTASAVDGACPNAEFRTGPSANLPECRAYEQISPVDKNGADLQRRALVSGDGNAALFNSRSAFAGYPSGGTPGPNTYYYSSRSDDRWVTRPAGGRPTNSAGSVSMSAASSDLRTSLLRALGGAFEPDPPPAPGLQSYYRFDNLTSKPTLLYQIPELDNRLLATSEDLSHVAFTSAEALTADPVGPSNKVFEASAEDIRLVSRQPQTGDPFSTAATVAGAVASGGDDASQPNLRGAVSEDGDHIFFVTPTELGAATEIYRRSNSSTTQLVSVSRRSIADPEGTKAKEFQFATPDGNRVFFASAQLLTDDANTGPARAGSDLYRYDFEADQLIDISATPGGNGAEVHRAIGVSEQGDRLYYVARGVVTSDQNPRGQSASAGEMNVFAWEDDGSPGGMTEFVATLDDPGDLSNWGFDEGEKKSRTTDDGRYLLLRSVKSLTGEPTEGTAQLYRFDTVQEQLVCISCRPDGQPTSSSADIPPFLGGDGPTGPSETPALAQAPLARVMNGNGRFVAFETEEALLPADTNQITDVYLWADGDLSLISTGTSSSRSFLSGMTVTGDGVFFITREALVPQDVDTSTDLYTARIGGGLLSQQAIQPPSCAGEECRGGQPQPPAGPAAASAVFSGPGNPPVRKRCGRGKRRVNGRNGKTRCVKRKKASRKNRSRANNDRRAGR